MEGLTLIGRIAGVAFYEDPVMGDEAPLMYFGPDGKLRHSDWWDLPAEQEVREWVNPRTQLDT